MVIDAEVVRREVSETPVASASSWEPPPPPPAASPSGRGRSKKPRKAKQPKPVKLPAGGLRIHMPEALTCPVCLGPALPDNRVKVGPVHAYLCRNCGDFAAGALQVVNFLKRFK